MVVKSENPKLYLFWTVLNWFLVHEFSPFISWHELEAESIGGCVCCCEAHWLNSKGQFRGIKDTR
jgi:hypothetical protein